MARTAVAGRSTRIRAAIRCAATSTGELRAAMASTLPHQPHRADCAWPSTAAQRPLPCATALHRRGWCVTTTGLDLHAHSLLLVRHGMWGCLLRHREAAPQLLRRIVSDVHTALALRLRSPLSPPPTSALSSPLNTFA